MSRLRSVKDDVLQQHDETAHVEPVFHSPPSTEDTEEDVAAATGNRELRLPQTLSDDPPQQQSAEPELPSGNARDPATPRVRRASRKPRKGAKQDANARDNPQPCVASSPTQVPESAHTIDTAEPSAAHSDTHAGGKREASIGDVAEHREQLPKASTSDAITTLAQVDLSDSTIEVKRPAPRDSAKHYFDQLKINFLARYATGVKSVLFLGITRGDGATTAAFNFAKSLAQDADLQVLFINADLRGPHSPEPVRHEGSESKSVALWEPHTPVRVQQDNLDMVPGGRGYADPAVLFQSKRFDEFMVKMTKQYSYVVIDGPPLDESPESIALTTKVDGVILVVDAQRTRRKIALHAKRRIEDVGGKLLGTVLNRRTFYVPDWLYRLI